MEIDDKTGLVLEGGGMRGVFTCGALDYLMDNDIYFKYVVGVSAGACNGLSYMSHQRGRAKISNIDLLDKYHYIGIKYLWKKHSILDQDLLYKEFPEVILPYDFEAYQRQNSKFEMVTTNCLTGRACYLEEYKNMDRLVRIARASSSLPYVCPITFVDNIPMLDGGLVDSIPIQRALKHGCSKIIVISTRNKGYRSEEKDRKIPSFIYKKYPRLRVVLSRRCRVYDEQLSMMERLEEEGRILVIRPINELKVDRIETDTAKLTQLYEEGYECAKTCFETNI